MKIVMVIVDMALFVLAVAVTGIPQLRTDTARIGIYALLIASGASFLWSMHKAKLLVNTTPADLYRAERERSAPYISLLSSAAIMAAVVALSVMGY